MFLTTKDLFNEVISSITLPEHTDYALAGEAIDIYDTDFSVYGKVNYGGSEGIYLDFMIEGCFGPDNEHLVKDLGTIKTLNDSDEAYRDFCNLIADLYLRSECTVKNTKMSWFVKAISLGKTVAVQHVIFMTWIKRTSLQKKDMRYWIV